MIVPRRTFRDAARVLWLASVLVLLAGYCIVESRFEKSIALSAESSERLYAMTVANDRIIEERQRLISLQATVDHDLAQIQAQTSARSAESLLDVLASNAARFRVLVLGVEPSHGQKKGKPVDPALTGEDVVIRVRGNFRSILRFIDSLPRQRALLSIDSSQIRVTGVASDDSGSPLLEATIQATSYTLHPVTEETIARTR